MFKKLICRKDFSAAMIIFLLTGAFFFIGFLKNQVIWGFDTPRIVLPFMFLLDESFKFLHLPLWSPDIYFGFPIGADGQLPWFYPFSILHVFLSFYLAVSALLFLHVFLAGIFTYLFARTINLGRFASLFASIAFMFNGFIIAHMQYFSYIYAYSYLPLILLFIELAISREDNFYFILAGAAFGLQILTGHPNIPIMTIIYAGLYALLRYKTKLSKSVIGIAIAVGVALLVALPYVLYTSRLIPVSTRGQGVNFEDATNSSFSLYDLVTFIFPNFFFDKINNSWLFTNNWHFWGYWGQIETVGYVGITTLFLIPFALLKKMRRRVLPFIILLFISVLFALGKNTPLYKLLLNIPVFNGLRAPGRFIFLTDFSLIILASFGIVSLFKLENIKNLKINAAIVSGSFLIASFVAIGAFVVKLYPVQVYNFLLQNYSRLGYVSNLDNPYSTQKMLMVSFQEQTKTGLVLIFISTLIILLAVNGFKNRVIQSAILVLVLIDLFVFASKVNIWKNFNELISTADPTINKLRNELTYDSGRVYTFDHDWTNLMPNQLIPYHIPEANGFASLPLKRFERWQKVAEAEWQEGQSYLFRQGSIKYVFDSSSGGLRVVDNYLPRAYVTNKVSTVRQEEESLALMTSPSTQLGLAVLESNNSIPELNDLKPVSQLQVLPAQINNYRPNYVRVTSNASFDGIMVLTDTNFPGWEAYVNGRKTSIYAANYLFRGVKLSNGMNIVEFKYKPRFINLAIFISFGTLIFVLLTTLKKLIKLFLFNKTIRPVSTTKLPRFEQ